MKKAFSLVEMALVVIIAGILIFVALSSASFYSNYKDKKEINRLIDIKNAYTSFLDIGGDSSPLMNRSENSMELIDLGVIFVANMLIPEDLVFNDMRNIDGVDNNNIGLYWLSRCTYDNSTLNLSVGSGACVVPVTVGNLADVVDVFSYSKLKQNAYFSYRYMCLIEVMLDDVDYYRGNGRFNKLNRTSPLNFRDCNKESPVNKSDRYAYKID